jgi:SAM-dependent methyltransferase
MILPRHLLIAAWLSVTLFAYYALLFTNLGNYYHGGGPVDKVLIDASAVLSAFLAIDILRSTKILPVRISVSLCRFV